MNQGKYVFAQIFEAIKMYDFKKYVTLYKGDYRVRSFSCWEHFLVMSFAQFTYRESLRDIAFCMGSIQHKLYHCGINTTVSRTTLAEANEKRDYRIYADFALSLMKPVASLYKGDNALSRELNSVIYAFDSTTISLCLNLFPWATYKTKQSAVKAHVLVNISGSIPEFVNITEGNVQDVTELDNITFISGCYYVMDKAYVDFDRLYQIEKSKAFFVTRAKDNMSYKVETQLNTRGNDGVIKDELVKLKRWHTRRWYPVVLRRIEYIDANSGKELVFLTNNMELQAQTIARLYKERWRVELFFKWVKQNLRIKKFYGHSANAVKVQIWIAVCDYLIIAILKKSMNIDMSLSHMLQILSINLFEKINIKDLFIMDEMKATKIISKQTTLF